MTHLDDRLEADAENWRAALRVHDARHSQVQRRDSMLQSWFRAAAVAVVVIAVVVGSVVAIRAARRSPAVSPITSPRPVATSSPTSRTNPSLGLAGVSWQLAEVVAANGTVSTSASLRTYAVIHFDSVGDAWGYDGCNDFNGTAKIDATSVTLSVSVEGGFACQSMGTPVSTGMAEFMTKTVTWTVRSKKLSVAEPDGRTLVFIAPPPADSTPAPADLDQFPARGCSPDSSSSTVTITINPDTPQPDCVAIGPNQKVRGVNNTNGFQQHGHLITLRLGHSELANIPPGEAASFPEPVGTFLSFGEHLLQTPGGDGGVVIWVR